MANPITSELRTAARLAASVRAEAAAGERLPSATELRHVLDRISGFSPEILGGVDPISLQLAIACLEDLADAVGEAGPLSPALENALTSLEAGAQTPAPPRA